MNDHCVFIWLKLCCHHIRVYQFMEHWKVGLICLKTIFGQRVYLLWTWNLASVCLFTIDITVIISPKQASLLSFQWSRTNLAEKSKYLNLCKYSALHHGKIYITKGVAWAVLPYDCMSVQHYHPHSPSNLTSTNESHFIHVHVPWPGLKRASWI